MAFKFLAKAFSPPFQLDFLSLLFSPSISSSQVPRAVLYSAASSPLCVRLFSREFVVVVVLVVAAAVAIAAAAV